MEKISYEPRIYASASDSNLIYLRFNLENGREMNPGGEGIM